MLQEWSQIEPPSILNEEPCRDFEKVSIKHLRFTVYDSRCTYFFQQIPQKTFTKIRSPAINIKSFNTDSGSSSLVRGDPDGGCVLNDAQQSYTPALSENNPSLIYNSELNHFDNKKGWLLKQNILPASELHSAGTKKTSWKNLLKERPSHADCDHLQSSESNIPTTDIYLTETLPKHDNNCSSTFMFTSAKTKLFDRISSSIQTASLYSNDKYLTKGKKLSTHSNNDIQTTIPVNLSSREVVPQVELDSNPISFSPDYYCISSSEINEMEQIEKDYGIMYQGEQEEKSNDESIYHDCTNFEEVNSLNKRLYKCLNENRLLRNELRESNKMYDLLEIQHNRLKYHIEIKNFETESQLRLFAARIEDLTAKYTMSEKNSRTLKQKLLNRKLSAEKRRSSSVLKGRESSIYQKEFEEKISELESKIESTNSDIPAEPELSGSKPDLYNNTKLKKRIRRKSLDSASSQSMQMILRLKALEKKMDSSNQIKQQPEHSLNENTANQLQFLKSILMASQDTVKKCLKYFQSLRVQKLKGNSDRKDLIKMLENCLSDVLKILDMSKELNPDYQMIRFAAFEKISSTLTKMENQIKFKLNDLVAKRLFLKETGQLTPQKELELFTERIAFESVMFGRLKASIDHIENDEKNREDKYAKIEIVETIQLMTSLKSRLLGNSLPPIENSTDLMVNLLTQRLVMTSSKLKGMYAIPVKPLDSSIVDELLKYNIELNELYRDYKRMIFDSLTTDFVKATDVPECLENFRKNIITQTNESINFEIIKLEINNEMSIMFHKLKNSVDSISIFNFNIQEDLKFENIVDEAHETLKAELDLFLRELFTYIKANNPINSYQPEINLTNEEKLIELNKQIKTFMDVVATKCLIDARINILLNQNRKKNLHHQVSLCNVPTIHNYEEFFYKLCSDQEISTPEAMFMDTDLKVMLGLSTKELSSSYGTESDEVLLAFTQLENEINSIEGFLSTDTTMFPNWPNENNDSVNTFYFRCTHLIQIVRNIFSHVKTIKALLNQCQNHIEKYKALATKQVDEINNLRRLNMETVKNWSQKTELQNQKLVNLESNCSNLKQILNNEHDQLFEKEDIISQLTTNVKNLKEVCSQKDNVIDLLQRQTENLRAQLSSSRLRYYDINVSLEKKTENELDQFENVLKKSGTEDNETDIEFALSPAKYDANEDSLRERYQIEIDQLRVCIIISIHNFLVSN